MENQRLSRRRKLDGTAREDTIREIAHNNADVYLEFLEHLYKKDTDYFRSQTIATVCDFLLSTEDTRFKLEYFNSKNDPIITTFGIFIEESADDCREKMTGKWHTALLKLLLNMGFKVEEIKSELLLRKFEYNDKELFNGAAIQLGLGKIFPYATTAEVSELIQ